jgi:tetratricopeptide (TPR) repeat protein
MDYYERATEAAQRAGDSVGAAIVVNNEAEIRLEQGRLDEAEELLRDVLASWRASGFAFGIGTALRNLGRIEMRRGDLDRAGELFERAREVFDGIGAVGAICEVEAFEAKRRLLTGDPEAGKLMAEQVQDRARSVDVIPQLPAFLVRVMGEATIAVGRHDAGVELLRESVAIADRVEAIYDQALGLDVLAEATGDAEYRLLAENLFARLGVVEAPSTGFRPPT